MTEPAFVYQTDIATTPERLWAALTSGELTRRYWYDRRIESDWSVGDPVRFYDGDTDVVTDTGTVLEYDPPRRLVYTFRPEMDQHGEPVDWAFTRVAFDLEPLEPLEPTDTGRVRLLLVHDRLASPEEAEGWSKGWIPILTSLRTFLQGPDPAAPAG
ncbi:MAG TPA: SRPBCC domain-containing protein [Mycobacteriales bacterium]|nr:SRPBCC domain-containing protein [Mycobacteriales bacterium]